VTATQSVDVFVFRAEAALHVGRAVPDISLRTVTEGSQLVLHGTSDFTMFEDMVTTFEVWNEGWSAKKSPTFDDKSLLFGFRTMKTFFKGEFEPSAGFMISDDGYESWSFLKVNFKFLESALLSAEAHWAKTSTGRVLARRSLKNLVRSSLSFQF
jgi:hypothetical protein